MKWKKESERPLETIKDSSFTIFGIGVQRFLRSALRPDPLHIGRSYASVHSETGKLSQLLTDIKISQ